MRDPLTDLLEVVDRLTKPIKDPFWQDVFDPRSGKVTGREPRVISRPALLPHLRSAIAASLGQTHAGHSDSSVRVQMNLTAYEMYEDIDGRIRALYRDTLHSHPTGLPESLLRQWYVHVRNLRQSNQITDDTVRGHLATLRGFVRRIEAMFDPEVVKELVGPCPNCEAQHWADQDGGRRSALYLHYRTDLEPEAMCRACGWNVSGPRGLLELGYHLGAVVDEEALREMGVIV